MFKALFIKKDKRTNLEKEIESVIKIMGGVSPESDDYAKMAANLDRLYKTKASESGQKRYVTPDTIAIIAANLLGIVLVLHYERLDTITSKAFSWIIRGRV